MFPNRIRSVMAAPGGDGAWTVCSRSRRWEMQYLHILLCVTSEVSMYLLFVVILLCCCCCCCCCCWLRVFIGELLKFGIHTKALFSFCEAVSTSYTPNVTHDSEADESPENVEGFQVPVTLIACHKDCRQ